MHYAVECDSNTCTWLYLLFFTFSLLNDSCNSEEFTFRDRAPTSPSREEVKAQAFERLQEELKKAQEVRNNLVQITSPRS